MKMLLVRNGCGLEFMISADRAGDIARLSLNGVNFSYITPAGMVAPAYYDCNGAGFLKSFTAGFFTTCGLTAVGSPCEDAGETLPLHGTISNIPCENIGYWIDDNAIHVKAVVRDAALFGHKLLLEREYVCSLTENVIYLSDTITNIDWQETPLEIMYHCNMGYPLLSEKAKLSINYDSVAPRDAAAEAGLDSVLDIHGPQKGYQEQCFYYQFADEPVITLYNEELKMGLQLSYDKKELPCFTQWKQFGMYEYALGLEPGNCTPDGRDVMRKKGMLEFLKPGASKTTHVKFTFLTEK